jgi:hypothetical protein
VSVRILIYDQGKMATKNFLMKYGTFTVKEMWKLINELDLVERYKVIINSFSLQRCWACQECLPGTSIHDCQLDFFMQIEKYFDEATELVNLQIFGSDNEIHLEDLEKVIFEILGCSVFSFIRDELKTKADCNKRFFYI